MQYSATPLKGAQGTPGYHRSQHENMAQVFQHSGHTERLICGSASFEKLVLLEAICSRLAYLSVTQFYQFIGRPWPDTLYFYFEYYSKAIYLNVSNIICYILLCIRVGFIQLINFVSVENTESDIFYCSLHQSDP